MLTSEICRPSGRRGRPSSRAGTPKPSVCREQADDCDEHAGDAREDVGSPANLDDCLCKSNREEAGSANRIAPPEPAWRPQIHSINVEQRALAWNQYKKPFAGVKTSHEILAKALPKTIQP